MRFTFGRRMIMKQRAAVLGVLMFFVVFLLLISSGAQAAEKKEIVVGTSLTLTGAQAAQGAEMKWSYEEAVVDANKAGGVFVKEYNKKLPVRLVIADDESDPGKAAAAVEKLINADKVDLLLATSSTPLVMASATTAEKYKKYLHATACIIPPWQAQKFKWSTLFFFDMKTFSDVPFSVMKTLPADSKVERPALLMDDSPDGRNMRPLFKASAEKATYTLVADEEWAVNAKDYSSLILKLKEKKVDAIVTVGTTTDIITLVRQMKENKFGVTYFHGYKGTGQTAFAKALGKDSQYIVTDGMWSDNFPYPGAQELGKRFYNKFERQSTTAGLWYATAQTLLQAIERAGTLDSAKVRDAVVNHEFKGTTMGDVKYGPDGAATFNQTASQWIDGQLKLVFPSVKGSFKAQPAPAWDKR
jgi:branched-chain amino acid transport system substrate-binding protein